MDPVSPGRSEYKDDIAIQKYILEKCGFVVRNAYLMILDNSYSRGIDLNVNRLFLKIKADEVARGDVAFKKFTAIFSANGLGKSTLADIFRSLSPGNSEIIEGRKTLGTSNSSGAEILISGSMHKYGDGEWDALSDNIHIYDSTFVNENVYGGNVVDHAHKRNLFRVIVGKKGVELAREIDDIDSEIRGINSNIKNEKQFLTGAFGKSVNINKACEAEIPADISSQITNKEKEIKAAEENKEIQSKSIPKKITLPRVPDGIDSLLSTSIDNVSASAEAEIEEHILKHDKKINERWVTSGLEAISDDECPFCGQNLDGLSLINAYKAVFAQEYKELKSEIEKIRLSIKSLEFDNVNIAKSDNDGLITFWRQYLDVEDIVLETDIVLEKFKDIKKELSDLIKKKVENPLEKINTPESYRTKLAAYGEASSIVDEYNLKIMALQTEIDKVKKSGGTTDLQKLRDELEWLKSLEKKRESDVQSSVNLYQELNKSKEPLEEKKKAKREELDKHTESIFPIYQQTINKYLENFDAGFSIVKTQGNFAGGKPSSNYQLVIKGVAFDLGDSKAPRNVASFKNTLSSGDKSTLALAFFLASLELEDKPEERIVVFDDPFTSQDRFRRHYTQTLILNECKRSKQVLLLSHDADFIKMVWDRADRSERKSLQIIKTSGSSSIVEWDIETESQSIHNRDQETLLNFFRNGDGDKVEVARAIRPWIEAWLRRRHLGYFSQDDSLGIMIGKIRNSESTDEIYNLVDSVDDLNDINDFSTMYQHGEDINRDRQSLDVGELTGYVKRALKFTGTI